MDFLKRAQDYAAARGDDNWFAERYAQYREEPFDVVYAFRVTRYVGWAASDFYDPSVR